MTCQAYADHHITPRTEPACGMCNGHGMIGGLLPNGGGYESEPRSKCVASRYPADGVESDGGETE